MRSLLVAVFVLALIASPSFASSSLDLLLLGDYSIETNPPESGFETSSEGAGLGFGALYSFSRFAVGATLAHDSRAAEIQNVSLLGRVYVGNPNSESALFAQIDALTFRRDLSNDTRSEVRVTLAPCFGAEIRRNDSLKIFGMLGTTIDLTADVNDLVEAMFRGGVQLVLWERDAAEKSARARAARLR